MKRTSLITTMALLFAGMHLRCEGPAGPPGTPGVACYSVEVGETPVDNTSLKQLQVDCPDGKKALGAGWAVLDSTSSILEGKVTYFQPAFDGSHWLVNAVNESDFAENWKLRVRVVCACVEEEES